MLAHIISPSNTWFPSTRRRKGREHGKEIPGGLAALVNFQPRLCPAEQDTNDSRTEAAAGTTVLSITVAMAAYLPAPSQELVIRPQNKGNVDTRSRGWGSSPVGGLA